jgi:uncharacterized protein YggU (UPF0235/DUF167 family)
VKITERGGMVSFAVRVQPRASRDEIAGEWQEGLKICLTAPPVDDRANEALRRFPAGERSRTKRVEVRGVTAEAVRALAD